MIYIFEGGDLVGKTTKAREFSNKTGFPIIKKRLEIIDNYNKNFLNKNNIEVFSHFFFESIFPLGKKYDFIIDRSLISSLVFTKFFNRTYSMEYVYHYLLNHNDDIQINYIYANDESLKFRYKFRKDKFFSISEILVIRDIYNKIIDKLIKEGIKINKIENNNV